MSTQPSATRSSGLGCWLFGSIVAIMVIATVAEETDLDLFDLTGSDGSSGFRTEDTTVYSGGTGGLPIRRFSPTDAQDLSGSLAEAEQRYGVCFGWKLTDGSTGSFDQGSSRGPTEQAQLCPRWVEAQVTVANPSSSSSLTQVDIEVVGSPEFDPLYLPSAYDYPDLGIDADVVAANPVGTTGHIARAVPLLMTESRLLPELPNRDAPVPAQVRPLPPAPGPGVPAMWWWGAGFGLVALLCTGFGLLARRRQAADTPTAQARTSRS